MQIKQKKVIYSSGAHEYYQQAKSQVAHCIVQVKTELERIHE